jgi:hypothetical protein
MSLYRLLRFPGSKKSFLYLLCVGALVFASLVPASEDAVVADSVQLGSDIDGEAAGDESGSAVAMSSDGSIVAIGAESNEGDGSISGHVRIYKYNGSAWNQLGNDIVGDANNDRFGTAVAMSSDGLSVAIGAPGNDSNGGGSGHVKIYEYDGSDWTQLGNDIEGEFTFAAKSGFTVAMSSDGLSVAIGAPGNDGNGTNSGHVRVYEYNGSAWTQLGNDIDGESEFDRFGTAVAMSNDGSRVAIGAPDNDGGGGSQSGHVRIYEYSGSAWTQLGNDIDGESGVDQSGYAVAMSSDGSRVAIGAPGNDGGGGSQSGHVRIYEYSGSAWTQLGNDIDGEAADDESGSAVAMSSDGLSVAIGAPFNDGNGNDSGHIRIYEYNGATWTQLENDIDGEAAGDESGSAVAMSNEGSRVAIGAPLNDGNGARAGHVRVFSISTTGCSAGFATGSGTSGNPFMITSVQELKEIEGCGASSKFFEIANDIDFGGTEPGDTISKLNGQLDGAGFTLQDVFVDSGLSIQDESTYFGLFGKTVNGSKLTNITFDGPKIETSGSLGYVGIIGDAPGTSFSDVTVRDATIGTSTANSFRSAGVLFGELDNFADAIQNVTVEGKIHCSDQYCGGVGGRVGVSSSNPSISNVHSEVEVLSIPNSAALGGVFGRAELDNTTTVNDISVEISGTDDASNVGGFAGDFYVSVGNQPEITLDRIAITGQLPPATNQGALVGNIEIDENLDVDYGEIVVGASFGGSATNSRLLVADESLNSGAVVNNDLSNAEVYHSTSFSSMSEYLPGTNSGGTFTQIATADRSKPATYSSFDITDNLSNSSNWYVQAADTRSELFGEYPVPYVLANDATFGPRLFFEPNGGTGTAVGRVAPLPNASIDPISNPFSRSGFEFDSWNNSASGSGQTFTQSSGITGLDGGSIYARWTELYDTTFDSNTADSGSVASIDDDNSITVPGVGNLVKEGFEFAGWNTSANGSGTPYSEGETLNLTADTTLFAQWQVPQSNPAPYSGPVITSVGSGSAISASSTETIRVFGERLGSISAVSVDGKYGEVISVAPNHFMMKLPLGLEPGTHDLVVESAIGNLTYLDAITIDGTNPVGAVSYGDMHSWTKRISDDQAKVYVKFPTVGEKVRIGHQTGGSGSYETVYVRTTSSETMEGLRIVEGVGTYVVRTIDLENINRIRVTVGEQRLVQVRYNQ